MFGKNCPRCSKKVSKKYDFCPFCGFSVKQVSDKRDYGLLGKEDSSPNIGMKMPFVFRKLVSTLLKQMDREFKKLDKQIGKENFPQPQIKPKGFSISISTAPGKKPEIRVKGVGPKMKLIEDKKDKPVKIPHSEISEAQVKKLAKLPREEAETRVRRMSDKLVYEIKIPGVKSLKNVIISRLENSIEIKAFSKDKVYVKLIPMAMPILDYKLSKEKLTIELKAK